MADRKPTPTPDRKPAPTPDERKAHEKADDTKPATDRSQKGEPKDSPREAPEPQ